ncbi:MAG: tetratricopeptide (TPR) repeat protein [Candidatus Paceibacteria bacterium]|jgi:tetratricopeptide (TPR) repeat protein
MTGSCLAQARPMRLSRSSAHFASMSSSRSMSTSPTWFLAKSLILAVAFSSCATEVATRDNAGLRHMIWEGNYVEGVQLATELRAADPADEQTLELYDLAYEGYFLDKGRQASFGGEDMKALDWFAMAREVAPESERVVQWQEKTKNKIADAHLDLGNYAYAREDYQSAADSYRLILRYMPQHAGAKAALIQVTRVIEFREDLGQGYYTDGVRSIADYRLRPALREFQATGKYLPSLRKAAARQADTEELIALERLGLAQVFEEEGLYSASHNEYSAALELDSNNELAKEGVKRLADEVVAARYLREARMEIYRESYDEAISWIDKGERLTKAQSERFSEARETIDEARLELAYQTAWDYEHDGDYAQAVKSYGSLLEGSDFYKDAMARKATLEGYIEMAQSYYEKAMDTKDKALKLEHLRSIQGFWPGYRDIEKQIERLE